MCLLRSYFKGLCLAISLMSLCDGLGFEMYPGIPEKLYGYSINNKVLHFYEFKLPNRTSSFLQNFNFHIQTTVSRNSSIACPLLFMVKQSMSSMLWNLPQFIGSDEHPNKYAFTSNRTMCLEPNEEQVDKAIIVEVTTCSRKRLNYTMLATFTDDVVISINKEYEIHTSISSPTFYKYYFTEQSPETLFVQIQSNSSDCALIAVRSPKCPVLHKEVNVRFDGLWHSFTTRTGMTIQKSEFPNGFFLSFTVLHDDSLCSQDFGVISQHAKNVSRRHDKILRLTSREGFKASDYTWALIVPLLFYATLIVCTFIMFLLFHRLRCKLDDDYRRTYHKTPEGEDAFTDFEEVIKQLHTHNPLYICHIRKMGDEDLLKKSKRYYLSMITILIFYLVPVFQLITHYMQVVKNTGEQDFCYYNYLCSHPFHKFKDFNHMYSNIGYIILGIYFLILVWIRERSSVSENMLPPLDPLNKTQRWQKFWPLFPKTLKRNDHGTIQPMGFYVAMALAHILEGFMSATYHICPNQSNFQFDMTFMYTIAVLNISKVYTYRHPVYISATLLFACLGMIACNAVFGLMFQSSTYLFCFTVVYGCFVFVMFFYLYHVGYIRVNGEIETSFIGVYKALFLFSFGWLRKRLKKVVQIEDHEQSEICFLSGKWKCFLPLLGGAVNGIIMVLVWTLLQKHNFATQVLTIFVVNSTGYTAYYYIMKIVHKECKSILTLQSAIYTILSFVYWIVGLCYFTIVLTSWETSAAESRVKNTQCVALDFYDFHDIWHFYSSAAMFCSYMILLTVDDDLLTVPQSKIPVF